MPPSSILPDLDSPLSLPDILEFNRKNNPTFAAYIYSDDLGNLTEISMLEFVHASYMAGNAVYGDSQPGDVVAIIANLDTIAYMALIAGLMIVGLVVRTNVILFVFIYSCLFHSPFPSPHETHLLLFSISCVKVLHTDSS